MSTARRFPDAVVRIRGAPGLRDASGAYVAGPTTERTIRASVQPLTLTDADLTGGVMLRERLRVYVPEPAALVAAFDDAPADRVCYRGHEYVVEASEAWPDSHTRATVLRET